MSFLGNNSNDLNILADTFLDKNWSIIPLRGNSDPQRPKAPALASWRTFQQQIPSQDTVRQWFAESDPNCVKGAIGIVLGNVSKLAVLDIDNPVRAKEFSEQFPHLINTLTIVSGNRELPHYYYQIPDDLVVPARMKDGVELRSDKQYVVAPGSVIGGRCWKIVQDREPHVLSKSDLSAILAFIGVKHPVPAKLTENREKSPFHAFSSPSRNDLDVVKLEPFAETTKLMERYHTLADRIGRNNALFFVTCLARDSGMSLFDARRLFVDLHIAKPAPIGHATETDSQRMIEALSTIGSVYKRPPRIQNTNHQLPNTVREYLLRDGQVNLARLLDGLMMLGLCGGNQYTAAQIYAMVAPMGIGRNVVYAVLKSEIDQEAIFKRSKNPPPVPPPIIAYAAKINSKTQKTCCFVRVAKPVKKIGRPLSWYTIPTIDELCSLLKVTDKGSDRLSIADLKSPAVYRSGLHAAMLRRAPGHYSRQWLAERIGVSEDSCRRYEQRHGIHVQPTYKTQTITKELVDSALSKQQFPGHFLEDDRGKRYPALPAIAHMLLAYGRRVLFRKQQVNHYSVLPSVESYRSRLGKQKSTEKSVSQSELEAPWSGKKFGQKRGNRSVQATTKIMATDDSTEQKMLRATRFSIMPVSNKKCCGPQQLRFDEAENTNLRNQNSRRYDDRSTDNTGASDRVYQQLRRINSARSLSRKRVQKLVDQYGQHLVEKGMKVISRRQDIRNPAGFLLSFLRAEAGSLECEKDRRNPIDTAGSDNEKSKECCGVQHSPQSEASVIESGLAALESQHQQWVESLKNSQYAAMYNVEF